MIAIYIKQNQFAKNVKDKNIYLEHGFKEVLLDDKYNDCTYQDFNEDLTFNIDKYIVRKQKETSLNYEDIIVAKIREKYSINQELAILRQRNTKPEEFLVYFDYVEQCKKQVKSE